jgi:hypothetical protein
MNEQERWLQQMLKLLFVQTGASGPRHVTLDQIGEAIGDAKVSTIEIEMLLTRLEAEGIAIGAGNDPDLKGLLRTVIQTAMDLRREGERPSPQAIAQRSSLSLGSVRVALLYSEVLRG